MVGGIAGWIYVHPAVGLIVGALLFDGYVIDSVLGFRRAVKDSMIEPVGALMSARAAERARSRRPADVRQHVALPSAGNDLGVTFEVWFEEGTKSRHLTAWTYDLGTLEALGSPTGTTVPVGTVQHVYDAMKVVAETHHLALSDMHPRFLSDAD